MEASLFTPITIYWSDDLKSAAKKPQSELRRAKFRVGIMPAISDAIADAKSLDPGKIRVLSYKWLRVRSKERVAVLAAVITEVCENGQLHVYEGHEDEESGTSHLDNDYFIEGGCDEEEEEDDDEIDWA